MLYRVRQKCRICIVLLLFCPKLLVAIFVPCSDKFTVPQHTLHVQHALTRPACLDRSRAPPSSSHNRRAGYLMAAILPKASSTSFLTCGL